MAEIEPFLYDERPAGPLFDDQQLREQDVSDVQRDALRALIYARIGVMANEFDYEGSDQDVIRFIVKQKLVIDITNLEPPVACLDDLLDDLVRKALKRWGFRTGIYGVRHKVEIVYGHRWWNLSYRACVITFKPPLID